MKSFAHYNVRSVTEAVDLMNTIGRKAMLIAGGTDLLSALKDKSLANYPEALINIKTIPHLTEIKTDESGGIKIGALATLADVISSPIIAETWPILKQAAITVASPQIRNVGTIGGNLCQGTRCWYYRYPSQIGGSIHCFRKGGKNCPAVPGKNQYHAILGAKRCFAVCPSDMAVALSALNATIILTGPAGTREVGIETFYTPLGTILEHNEMVTAIHIPNLPWIGEQTFLKFTLRKPIDFAIVSAASRINLDGKVCAKAVIVLGAVAPVPLRCVEAEKFLEGKLISEEKAAQAAQIALAGAKPLSQNAYKVKISKFLIKRVITDLVRL
jgi:xanthine dehydrogenase YagS FAD-binding subunit